jgi:restriction system protein
LSWYYAKHLINDLDEGKAVAVEFHDIEVAQDFRDCASKLGDWATIDLIDRRSCEKPDHSQQNVLLLFLLAFSVAEILLWVKLCAWAWRGAKINDGFGTMFQLVGYVAILALPCAVFAQSKFCYLEWRKRRDCSPGRRMPCKHGVAGALHGFVSCSTCDVERSTDEEIRVECFKRFKQRQDADNEELAAHKKRAEELAARMKREADESVVKQRERERLELLKKIRLPDYLKKMHPRTFELLICVLFRKWGYDVEETPYSGDGGIDGHLRRNQEHLLLQCKRTKGGIGVLVVRDLFGAIHGEQATGGVLVTTGRVSDQARVWIRDKARGKIRVIELDELVQLIRDNFREDDLISDGHLAS